MTRKIVGFAAVGVVGMGALALACAPAHPAPSAPSPAATSAPEIAPTPALRRDTLVETLHGTPVADPYRWLEDGASPDVAAFTDRQNQRTRRFLDAIPGLSSLTADVRELLEVGYVNPPAVTVSGATRRYFYTKREGSQNQPTLYVRDGAKGSPKVLLDVSALSADGTTALDWWYPSWDGKRIAWGRSDSGSEESTLFVRDVDSGADLADRIPRTRHASLAWEPSGKAFFYSRYPEPGSVPPGDEKYFSRIYRHVLGEDAAKDALVFGEGRARTDIPVVAISPNGRWLTVQVHLGWDKSEIYLKDLSKGLAAPWTPVVEKVPALFEATPLDDKLYILTNDGASRYKLVSASYASPGRAGWKTVLAEGEDVLDNVTFLKQQIVAGFMHEASSRLERFGYDGKTRGSIALPGIGSARATGAWNDDEAFFSYASYVVPPTVRRIDLKDKDPRPEIWDSVGAKFVMNDVEVSRLWATSKDGTKVPMFVIAKKGLARDGKNAAILTGYGGFNASQTPSFNARALASVQHGAVWAVAVLRGGGEFGEAWHQAGMLDKKQNVFDDFAACAEALVAEKITEPGRLGMIGGSNGGLLVATTATQRPELFRAGLALVPLTDMVRFPRFLIAKLWVSEYGDPASAEDFRWLYAYSPYHHVKAGVRYPAMMFTTAQSDSRVDPLHARKMAAAMQEVAKDPERPVLLRVETKAGHGAGKPVTLLAQETADGLGFLLHELGLPLTR